MDIALMNLRITFQKNIVESDEIGNHTNTWKDWYSCHATISGESGAEKNAAGLTVPTGNASFTVRYSIHTAAITTDGYRIRWGDAFYNITAIDHLNYKKKALKFWVEKVRR